MGQINVGDEVKTKIAEYFDKDGHRCTRLENPTVTIPAGTIGKITKIEGMPVYNTAQVYFKDVNMHVAFLILHLERPYKN